MITIPDRAFAAHGREMTADVTVLEAEDWTPTLPRQISDQAVEDWIEHFARTGDIEDRFGKIKCHNGTVTHRVAQQWVADKSKVGEVIGPAFWDFAKACAWDAGY